MAQTMQSISPALVEIAQSQYTLSSSSYTHPEEPEDNLSLMFSLCDSATNLCISLEKLHHAMKMKNIELQIKLKEKEKHLLSKVTSPLKRLKEEEGK